MTGIDNHMVGLGAMNETLQPNQRGIHESGYYDLSNKRFVEMKKPKISDEGYEL